MRIQLLTRRAVTSLVLALAASASAASQATVSGVDRIVAVGDVHGDFDQLVRVLRQTGVIDGKNRWIGAKTHLVQTGDILDRGANSRQVMDLLMALEKEAIKAGGRVHALIGNHEAMNILGDLRYVSPGEYEAFRTGGSKGARERAFQVLADSTRRNDSAYRAQWEAERPLGWIEHRIAFEGKGSYGDWIREHPAVLKIDGYLFLHGGIGPAYADSSIAALNAAVQRSLEPSAGPSAGIAEDSEGPLWYRGLAQGNEAELAALVDQVLATHGVEHVVIGHTVTAGTVLPRFGGKVIMIDVGLAAAYGGPPAALVIERGVPYTVHRGHRLPLPTDGNLLPYLEAAAALDPPPSRLQKLIEELKPAPAH
jgi:hypothetical protein